MVRVVGTHEAFTEFVGEIERPLAYALASAYGPEVGREATADALLYAWRKWEKVSVMDNPAGYLFRVGQSSARRYFHRRIVLPPVAPGELPHVEPALPVALSKLPLMQRVAVVLIHGQGYGAQEAGDLLGVSRSTARKHAERGMAKLRRELGVSNEA
jgi:DNA-directed RNA polymerase specialized sigma24 family protein